MSWSAISRTWPGALGNSASHCGRTPRRTSAWSSLAGSSRTARAGSPCRRWSRRRCSRAPAGSGLHVWLKVDCGYHRAGVNPASPYALKVAAELGDERGLVFDGILSHSGHAYRTTNRAEAARVAEQERNVMVGFAGRLRPAGLPGQEVSVGSAPAGSAG